MFLVGHNRGVWLKLSVTCKFYTSKCNIKWKPILIYLTCNMFKVQTFEKSDSLVIQLSSIHSVSISNQCCDLPDCPWKWYCGSDIYGLHYFIFLHLQLFHLVVSCNYLLPNQYLCHLHIPFDYSFNSHYYYILLQPKVPSRPWSSE